MPDPDAPGCRTLCPPFTVRPAKPLYAGRQVKYAMIEPTKQCPYRCEYCYQGCGPEGLSMAPDMAWRVCRRLASDGWRVWPVLPELMPGVEPYLGLLTHFGIRSFSTSGDPLVERAEWFRELERHGVTDVRITVFPTRELHERFTGRDRKAAVHAVRSAQERGFRVTWNFLLCRSTAPYLAEQVGEAERCGAGSFNVNVFHASGRARALSQEMISAEELGRARQEFVALRWRLRRRLRLDATGMIGPVPGGPSERLSLAGRFCLAGCGPHGALICIDADRTVYGCLTHREPDLRMGTVDEDGRLHMSNAPFVERYHRRRCCIMDYHWTRLAGPQDCRGPIPAQSLPAAGP